MCVLSCYLILFVVSASGRITRYLSKNPTDSARDPAARPPLRLGLVEDRARAGAKSLGPEEHAAGQGQEAEDRIDVAIYYDTV